MSKIEFPPYTYQPYPKALYSPQDGAMVIVQDEDEHARQMVEWGAHDEPSREELEVAAAELGVKVDGRWSDARLAKEIEAARK